MSIFVTILFFLLWSVIPTAVEGITNAAKITGMLLAIPTLWMLVIWVDRVMLSRREGMPA
jgi:membrane associated rhomboid family serine protease